MVGTLRGRSISESKDKLRQGHHNQESTGQELVRFENLDGDDDVRDLDGWKKNSCSSRTHLPTPSEGWQSTQSSPESGTPQLPDINNSA